jgi:hypothetical protein
MELEKFRVPDDDKGKKNAYVFKPEDVYDVMLNDLRVGKVKGTTTYNTNTNTHTNTK